MKSSVEVKGTQRKSSAKIAHGPDTDTEDPVRHHADSSLSALQPHSPTHCLTCPSTTLLTKSTSHSRSIPSEAHKITKAAQSRDSDHMTSNATQRKTCGVSPWTPKSARKSKTSVVSAVTRKAGREQVERSEWHGDAQTKT